ncbi:MAG: cobalt-precorrin-6A reductase [Cyanobacteria bacterium P01_G01_bin.38]
MGLAPSQRLWIIGGTQESAAIVRAIARTMTCQFAPHKISPASYLVSVTTSAAVSLYPAGTDVWVGQLTPETLPKFLNESQIGTILDASHPFATTISELAIAAAHQYSLPYLRYERPSLTPTPPKCPPIPPDSLASSAPTNLLTVPDYPTLLTENILAGQRVLLTVGYRALSLFAPWQARATLFARILPSATALAAAQAAGFEPRRLIAVRPPLTPAFEKALWQQWQITTVVAKASGVAGGESVKHQIAQALGIQLVIMARPTLAYPQVTHQLSEAITFALKICGQSLRSGAKLPDLR